mgnify:CR=1 FL=1
MSLPTFNPRDPVSVRIRAEAAVDDVDGQASFAEAAREVGQRQRTVGLNDVVRAKA